MITSISEEKRNKQVAKYRSWVAKRGELGFWNVPGWREHQNIQNLEALFASVHDALVPNGVIMIYD